MITSSLQRFLLAATTVAATLATLPAQAAYGGLVIFGDSLSDSGNNFIALNPPPPPATNITPNSAIGNNSFIPQLPYLGAPIPVYSNGPVWATTFASALGLSNFALPSLAGGANFAFGGAVTGGSTGFPPSLTDQLGQFLGATSGVAPASFLYVVAGGGNDARAALAAVAADPGNAQNIIDAAVAQYASNVGNIVDDLQAAGATDIVVWNTPNLGAAPAVQAQGPLAVFLGTGVAAAMNIGLADRLSGETGVQTYDLFGVVSTIVANPGAFGLSNVTDACIAGACLADEQLFWDGIHPTARGHTILAQTLFAQVVPEPETYLLFALGLAALGWHIRKRAA